MIQMSATPKRFFLKDIKSFLLRQMDYAKHDDCFCFRPEQGVQQQEAEENYGYLAHYTF